MIPEDSSSLMQSFTHVHVRKMLIGAYLNILNQKDEINRVNLFPVPDKDTGSNLVRTLRGVYEVITPNNFRDMEHLRHEALEGALVTSAGNAGIIVTSFLEGFLTSLEDVVFPHSLVSAFAVGSDHAFASVQQPKSGTILDVMRETAWGLRNSVISHNPSSVLLSAHTLAESSLSKTKTSTPVSLRGNVVDAGGLGFVLMLQGFIQGITRDDSSTFVVATNEVSEKSTITLQEKQHEVVALLGDVRASRKVILDTLAKHGDSIDIVELYGKMKIHIHTDNPAKVRQLLGGFGTLLETATVDMNEGEKASFAYSDTTIGIVVDEGASLSQDYITRHGICVVPFQFQWDSQPNLSIENLYKTMRSVDRKDPSVILPRTSQPSPHSFLQAFRHELLKHKFVICILTSSLVSGTRNSAQHARNLLSKTERERVFIPDFRQALAGQTLLIRAAIEFIKHENNIEHVIEYLMQQAANIHVFGFGTDTFWLVKGGRMSTAISIITNILLHLSIQPVIGLRNGKLSAIGIARRKKSLADMAYHYLKNSYGVGNVNYDIVLHNSDVPDEVAKLKALLQNSQFNIVDSLTLSPIAGIHIGPGALIVAVAHT